MVSLRISTPSPSTYPQIIHSTYPPVKQKGEALRTISKQQTFAECQKTIWLSKEYENVL